MIKLKELDSIFNHLLEKIDWVDLHIMEQVLEDIVDEKIQKQTK